MAELNIIQFILFGLSMIFPVHALDVFFSSAFEDFKQKSEINTYLENGEKTYDGTLNPMTYQPKPDTSKVIVYIIDRSRFVEIIRNAVRAPIFQIAQELSEWHYELVFLGIDNFDEDEYHLISAFMVDKIQPHDEEQRNFTFETMGENHFDRIYQCHVWAIARYQENPQICGGALRARLRNIQRGALRPVGSNGKEIRLYGFHPTMGEVKWPVRVVNNTYLPEVNVSDPKYNFRLRSRKKKICVLILDGREYLAVFGAGRWRLKSELEAILDKMTKNRESLVILGAFNFDWTEIDIVTQIILHHSIGWGNYDYNVFTYGYGMFNTVYLNVYEAPGRYILQQPKSYVTELIDELLGEEVNERYINMFYSEERWKVANIPMISYNGRYVAGDKFRGLSFTCLNQKIAFIVYDSTEKNDPIDYPTVSPSVEELKQYGIYVIVIEAINFGLDDIHIIAEWIDYHRGVRVPNSDREVVDSEQIAVLGGGIFDTLFQSESTTYKTFFDTKRNELKRIRNAIVSRGNEKRVLIANMYIPRFKVWTHTMNTVNGFYEPGLIPDKNMFDTTAGKQIFFIISDANCSEQTSLLENARPVAPWLSDRLEKYFPPSNWNVLLVGLDSFGERDHHLFAEFVKVQTHDVRSLHEFVLILHYAIGDPIFQYKDTRPFPVDTRSRIQSLVQSFFEMTSRRSDVP